MSRHGGHSLSFAAPQSDLYYSMIHISSGYECHQHKYQHLIPYHYSKSGKLDPTIKIGAQKFLGQELFYAVQACYSSVCWLFALNLFKTLPCYRQ